ncbi:hypothetical protein [Micavibrio aeruginosavorus]|uniref:Secreted protein n=1 Tax=Micavibrio aeruginosavorus EPB TaxID=349215 RepID=M4VDH3_9BACT|nr:hypothetical protein [Micavibrio aeruginosavorus]AGH97283.1 hypothetical protein A11S_456 [Micavibrio aeruginosavorus EPB]
MSFKTLKLTAAALALSAAFAAPASATYYPEYPEQPSTPTSNVTNTNTNQNNNTNTNANHNTNVNNNNSSANAGAVAGAVSGSNSNANATGGNATANGGNATANGGQGGQGGEGGQGGQSASNANAVGGDNNVSFKNEVAAASAIAPSLSTVATSKCANVKTKVGAIQVIGGGISLGSSEANSSDKDCLAHEERKAYIESGDPMLRAIAVQERAQADEKVAQAVQAIRENVQQKAVNGQPVSVRSENWNQLLGIGVSFDNSAAPAPVQQVVAQPVVQQQVGCGGKVTVNVTEKSGGSTTTKRYVSPCSRP